MNFVIIFILVLFLESCSSNKEEVSLIKETNQQAELITTYSEAMKNLKKNDTYFAANKFLEAELLFPQSVWAPRAVLMSAYGYFSQGYYSDAINDLERFLIKYKNHPQTDYAYYFILS